MYPYSYPTMSDSAVQMIIILLLVWFVIKLLLALIPAKIARNKGFGFAGFYLYGLFFFFTALIIALCLNNRRAELNELKAAIASLKQPTAYQPTP